MEVAQERELEQPRQAWWPLDLDTMEACGVDVGDGCFLLGWDHPRLRCFGLELGVVGGGGGAGAAAELGDHNAHRRDELELFFPKCMELPVSEASNAASDLPAAVMPEDQLDALLQSFWDSDEEQLVGFDSSCILKEKSTTTLSSSEGDDLLALSSVSPAGPTVPEREDTVAQLQAERPPSSSSSTHCNVGPEASDTGGAQAQATRDCCSSKRSATTTPETGTCMGSTEADNAAWSGRSSKRSRRQKQAAPPPSGGSSSSSVVYPFAVVKPSGVVDGGATRTLADINARILTRPARPVRHPVGEFACAPRVSCGGRRLAPSGKVAAGFVRLHTAGRGTITITRTAG